MIIVTDATPTQTKPVLGIEALETFSDVDLRLLTDGDGGIKTDSENGFNQMNQENHLQQQIWNMLLHVIMEELQRSSRLNLCSVKR